MKRKILSLMLVINILAVLFVMMSINVSAMEEDVFTYSIKDGKATIIECDWSVNGKLVIPKTLGGYPVTIIGEDAFSGCKDLRHVVIPNGVISIENDAFSSCENLESIEIPDSVISIGEAAFSDCVSLENIEIPNSVTSIGEWAFYGCIFLESIEIPNSVTSIGEAAFSDCASLISIIVDNNNPAYCSVDGILFSKNKSTLIQYPAGKFNTYYIIPNGVTSVGASAFYQCYNLIIIEIPNSIMYIGDSAFSRCSNLKSIIVDNSNPAYCSVDGILYNKNKSTLIQYPAGKFNTYYIIPNGVTSIGDSAFDCCQNLISIEIPDSVTCIGKGAFTTCRNLENIEIPNSVTSIGDRAFFNCYNLISIELPDNLTSIGDRAFFNCYNLISIELPDNLTSIGDMAFRGCNSLEAVLYKGTVDEWKKISIDIGNTPLTDAVIHFIPNTKTTLSDNDKSFTVTPKNVENGKIVILALYDGEKFVEMQKAVYSGNEVPFETTKAYTKAKVMVWNNLTNVEPLCEEENVK